MVIPNSWIVENQNQVRRPFYREQVLVTIAAFAGLEVTGSEGCNITGHARADRDAYQVEIWGGPRR